MSSLSFVADLDVSGSRYYRNMYDGGHLNDGGQLLHQLAQSFKPSRQKPCMLRPHKWVLSGLTTEQKPDSPWLQSSEAQDIALNNATMADTRDSPVSPRQREIAAEDVYMVTCKTSPYSDSSPAGGFHPSTPELECLADRENIFIARDAGNMDNSITSTFRDEHREHRSSPSPSCPEKSVSTTSCVQDISYREGSRKRLRDLSTTDGEYARAVKARRFVCVNCRSTNSKCDSSTTCYSCRLYGSRCVYKRCRFGLGCRHPKCFRIHPGQYDSTDGAWIVEDGSMPRKG